MGSTPIHIDVEKFLLWIKVAGTDREDLPILSIAFSIVNEYGADDQCLRTTRLCFQSDTLWQYVPSWDSYYRVGTINDNYRSLYSGTGIPRRQLSIRLEDALQKSGRFWYIGRYQPRELWNRDTFWLPGRRVEKRTIAEFLESLTGDQEIDKFKTPPEVARQLFEDWLRLHDVKAAARKAAQPTEREQRILDMRLDPRQNKLR